MNRALNKEILRLAIPSILANLTVPLVGMVDTAVAGHLSGGGAAAFIGGISVGSMLFSLLYWGFGFLRTGTGGLTAQAFGRRDCSDQARILARGILISLIIAAVLLLIQWPFVKLSLLVVHGTPEVEKLASDYFFIRIWAAPATLSLMAFSGWFVGMQDSMSSMWKDFVVNGVNIAASILLSMGIGGWEGLGFRGVALGTVIAQYSGLLFCVAVCFFKYRRTVFGVFSLTDLKGLLRGAEMKEFFKMNLDLFGRSVGFIAIYIGYTAIAARFGDIHLACSAIMMQLLMVFSYFTDGFAYAGEALTGRFIGAKDNAMLRRTVKYVFAWSMGIGALFIGIYILTGEPMIRLMTSDKGVIEACCAFIPWLAAMPPLGCAAFTWDGIYMGATDSRRIRNAMLGAAVAFFAVWLGVRLFYTGGNGETLLHILLAAYFAHLLFRTVYLSWRYPRSAWLQQVSSPKQ